MAESPRSQEIVRWSHCLIYRNCDERVEEFMTAEGAEELVVVCAALPDCQLTEVYIRSPEPREMACKVIGSICAKQSSPP